MTPEGLQLLPIKLVPGFIAIDLVHGCVGCNFCVARRNSLVDNLFDARGIETFGSDGEEVVDCLLHLPSFWNAKIPLRIGNDSDYAFQRSQAKRLLAIIPSNYPAVVLTRFSIPKEDTQVFTQSRPNLLLKVTLTPRSSYLSSPSDPFQVLDSIKGLEGNVLITIGPLVADNAVEAAALLDAVPRKKNFSIYLKRLDKDGLPKLAKIPELPIDKFKKLVAKVGSEGFRKNTFMLCLIFRYLSREDPRSVDIPKDEIKYCFECPSRSKCWADEEIDVGAVDLVANQLGLKVLSIAHTDFRTLLLEVDKASAFGDEAYFSYMLGRKVRLSMTRTGTINGTVLATETVLDRWEENCFFPANDLYRLASTNRR